MFEVNSINEQHLRTKFTVQANGICVPTEQHLWTASVFQVNIVTVAESLCRDLVKVSGWCDLLGLKLNARKTKTMIVSRSQTMHPPITCINYRWNCAEGVWWPWYIKSGIIYSKKTFEKHLGSAARAASQLLGILRKAWQVFHARLLLGRYFRGFVLPVLQYCSAVWCSAADLKLVDRVVSGASFLIGGVFECDLAHRRSSSSNGQMQIIRSSMPTSSNYCDLEKNCN